MKLLFFAIWLVFFGTISPFHPSVPLFYHFCLDIPARWDTPSSFVFIFDSPFVSWLVEFPEIFISWQLASNPVFWPHLESLILVISVRRECGERVLTLKRRICCQILAQFFVVTFYSLSECRVFLMLILITSFLFFDNIFPPSTLCEN